MKVIIAAGGTAGHINPALAIAAELSEQENNCTIKFIGTEKGMEHELVKRAGYEIEAIETMGLIRKITFKNFAVVYKGIKSYIKASKIIRQFKPDIVIGCGGYVSGPVVFSAYLAGIKTLIHEQNVSPGLTTKILSKFVSAVAVSFEKSKHYLKSKKIVVTGNPVRQGLFLKSREDAKKELNLQGKKLILIVGGSLGAQKINDVAMEMFKKHDINADVLWAAGKKNYAELVKIANENKINKEKIQIVDYIYNMETVMAAADLIIGRSGAITVSEISALGRASLLIPSPNVTDNHQEFNALALSDIDAAKIIPEKKLTEDVLFKSVCDIINNDEKRANMESAAKSIGKKDASRCIYSLIKEVLP